MMKKTGFIIGLFATAFVIAVANKMQKINANKDSAKGKAKELAGDMVGASKEVLEDLKEAVSSVFSSGATDKVAGKAKEVTGDKKQEVEGLVDQATGETKKVADKAKDKVEDVVEDRPM